MKRRFTITIDIDDQAHGYSCVDRVGDGQYMVNIRKDVVADMSPIVSVVAHEIGHVLTDEFGVTRVLTLYKDSTGPISETPTFGQVLHAEEQAWKVADEIHKSTRERCLGTYTKAYESEPPDQKIYPHDQRLRLVLRSQVLKSMREEKL